MKMDKDGLTKLINEKKAAEVIDLITTGQIQVDLTVNEVLDLLTAPAE